MHSHVMDAKMFHQRTLRIPPLASRNSPLNSRHMSLIRGVLS
jgi:hypothetical protein